MDALQAIHARRATRQYTDQPIDESTIRLLLEAAIQAPTGMNLQPWAFCIVQDPDVLKQISAEAVAMLGSSAEMELVPLPIQETIRAKTFDIFYNCGTLIIVCAHGEGPYVDWDCCFAAQNLMIAARSMGLGTCPIGFAWSALALPQIRERLEIPEGYHVVLPIIVGQVDEFPPSPGRKPPEILNWIREKAPTAS